MSDTLFDAGLARDNDPDTSRAAATCHDRINVRHAIIDAMLAAGPDGLTDDELVPIVQRLTAGALGPTVKTARSALTRHGEKNREGPLRRTGITRLSDAGSPMIVHVHEEHTAP